jgi:hypothetical protein
VSNEILVCVTVGKVGWQDCRFTKIKGSIKILGNVLGEKEH